MLDIDGIERYSVSKWGERVASKYLADLDSAIARIAENPGLLQVCPDTSLRLRFHLVREHVPVCDAIGHHVFILAVRYAAMDLPHRLAELEPQLLYECELLARRIANSRTQ